jgi:hypothetical protein
MVIVTVTLRHAVIGDINLFCQMVKRGQATHTMLIKTYNMLVKGEHLVNNQLLEAWIMF